MRQCEHCGAELRANARFCGRCGKRVDKEVEATTNSDDASIAEVPVSAHTSTVVFNESRDATPEDDVEEQQAPPFPVEEDVEEEELPPLVLEEDVEEVQQLPQHTPEEDVEEEELPQLVLEEDVEEEQTDIPGLGSSTVADLDVEPEGTAGDQASPRPSPRSGEGEVPLRADIAAEKGTAGDHKGPPSHSAPPSPLRADIAAEKMESPANQVVDEQPQLDQTPVGQLAALSASVSAPGRKARASSVPKVLLFLLAVVIIASGCVAALIGLFQWHFPGISGAASALSSSSVSETVNTAAPPLSASVCAGSSAPGTSSGIGLTLSTPSGCSSFNIASATSLCLIFPYNPGALHKYILNVSGVTVDSKAYHLVLSIAKYTGPTSYNDGDHVTIGIGEGSTGVNFSWLYRSGNVTINRDEQSGTMDVILESASGGNTIHVVGGWMCGRLTKIK